MTVGFSCAFVPQNIFQIKLSFILTICGKKSDNKIYDELLSL